MSKLIVLIKTICVAVLITGCVVASFYLAYVLVIMAVILPVGWLAYLWFSRKPKINYFDYINDDE